MPTFASPAHAERVRRLPTPWQMFRFVTDSEHLHFGLFERPDEPIVDAQERNMERLLPWIPAAPRRILDVGCGIGGTGVTLAERGYSVVGIAPDAHLIEYATELARERGLGERCQFFKAALFDVPKTEIFDVVLSQESMHYLHPLEQTMEHFVALCRPGGRVVIGDQVLHDPAYKPHCLFHSSDEIRTAAERAGLRLIHHEDVTRWALHTVPVGLRALERMRPGILEFFRPAVPDIEQHFETCLRNGGMEAQLYEKGLLGYEHFAFDR
jgi:MPBQ/MSBQ methyltransferase